MSGKQQTDRQTNKSGSGSCFSPLSSHQGPPPLENTLSLYPSRSDAAQRHASLARVRRCCASRPQKKGKKERGGVESGAARRNNNDKKKTHTQGSTHQGRSMQSLFPAKREEERRREPLGSNRGEHVNASLFVPLLLPPTC